MREERMISAGDAVVAGVSGGPDSMAMLLALVELRAVFDFELSVAHLHHGLRGAEADEDEEFVKGVTARLGIPLMAGRVRKKAPAGNIEEWAREERYRFLAQAADRAGAGLIAVAHTMDDVAETVLINLIRGAGATGLAGIAPVREASSRGGKKLIIRPLIRLARADVLAFLAARGQKFREDSMNQDPRFIRVRVRRELMPLLASMNPAISRSLARAASVSRHDVELLQGLARKWMDANAGKERGAAGFAAATIAAEPTALRMAVYREAVRAVGRDLRRIAFVHLEAIDRLVMAGAAHASLDLPGITVKREYGRLSFGAAGPDAGSRGRKKKRAAAGSGARGTRLLVPGSIRWPGPDGEWTITADRAAKPRSGSAPVMEAWFDAEKVLAPLMVRARRPGDRYSPSGMKGRRLVKDIMNELKIPPRLRGRYPLICDPRRILWVPGLRPAAPGKGIHIVVRSSDPSGVFSPGRGGRE
ncbi:MAG TPA: tRNA lysidine(34) synthetase TilS [bacterium]|nr:tRNA lysidine(34) synthetase TilS [bacterium]